MVEDSESDIGALIGFIIICALLLIALIFSGK